MTKRTATAEIRRTDQGYVAVTQVGKTRQDYPLPADPADAAAYAEHFRAEAGAPRFSVPGRRLIAQPSSTQRYPGARSGNV
jgi:hypothetical protein